VYSQAGAGNGNTNGYTLVKVQAVVATSLVTNNANVAAAIKIG
jgi:hypothetical protein